MYRRRDELERRRGRSRSPLRKRRSRSRSPRYDHSKSRRDRSRSPRRDHNPRSPSPTPKVRITRDYNHGKPKDDNEVDILADIEWRRKSQQQRLTNEDRLPFQEFANQSPPSEDYDQGGSYNPHGSYSNKGSEYRGVYHGDVPADSSQHPLPFDSFEGIPGKMEDEGEYVDDSFKEMASMFSEELDILEGNVKTKRNYKGIGFNCDVCNIYVTSMEALQVHFAGVKHKKKLTKRGLSGDFDPLVKLPKDESVCESIMKCTLCNVILQGSEINVHSESAHHQEILSQLRVNSKVQNEMQWYEPVSTVKEDDKDIEISENHFECKLCGVILPKEELFEKHLNGKKHQKKLRWKHVSECDPEGYDTAQFWCGVCNIFCTNRDVLDQHFAGKQHAKMLRTKGVSENDISQGLEENAKIFTHKTPTEERSSPPPTKKSGLYGSLPEVAASQRKLNSSEPSSYQSRSSASQSSSSQSFKQPSTSSSNRTRSSGKAAPIAPLSVGSFLQSIGGEDPMAKTTTKVEPEIVEQPTKGSAVTEFLNKISYQYTGINLPHSANPKSTLPPQPPNHQVTANLPPQSTVEQLKSKKYYKYSGQVPTSGSGAGPRRNI